MELWRGTVAVTPYDRRLMVVTDAALRVDDPTGAAEPLSFDLAELADNGVLLPYAITLTLVDPGTPEPTRLLLRAVDPPTFDGIPWPPHVQERIDEQLAASAAARARLRRQLGMLVAATIAGLALVLVVLAVALLLN